MNKLVLKGVDPKLFIEFVKKSARVRDKKGDKMIAESLPFHIHGDKISSIKENGTKTTMKISSEKLSLFCENYAEVIEKLGDNICRIWLFSSKTFVSGGLKHFKDKINIELTLNDNFDATGHLTLFNESAKIRFSLADASSVFEDINFEDIDDLFDVSDAKASFNINSVELKKIGGATKLESVLDKKHESVGFFTEDGYLTFKTHSVDLKLHETDVNLSGISIKKDLIFTICEEDQNVFIKTYNNIPIIVFKSTETDTRQYIILLDEFSEKTTLDSVEEEIEQIDFATWADMGDEDPLF